MSLNIGYLFKPTHHEIHYVKKGASLDLRRKYERNFSTDIKDAATFECEEKAMQIIIDLVAKFRPSGDYVQTPVIVYSDTGTYKMFTCGQWSKPTFKINSF